jgi:UDP-N-acetylglucosamine--N-acetylmuramyl-(pentapeptide) pyrophosphoryl-undecaprenol N-acetylglucosamine transferase
MKALTDEEKRQFRLMVAGGGTGGHLFPGLAVAKELKGRHEEARILFVTGKKRMESEIIARSGFDQASIAVEGMKGRGWKGAQVMLKLPWSFFQSLSIMHEFKPHLVFGVGGYSSGPVCLAARVLGIPAAVHEQNSYPGVTNRLLCRVVDRVFISFEESRAHFGGGNLYLTGNPIREEFLVTKPRDLRDPRFTVLVIGGSQGARAVNDAMVEALVILKERGRDLRVIHQTGRTDHDRIQAAYREKGLQGEVSAFIQDMAGAYARADLVVSRAGAGAIFEVAALGKPSILIPFPFAANNHQETNARVLVEAGGAEMVLQGALSGEVLADAVLKYMDKPELLAEMGEAARRVAKPDAAQVIANLLMDMIKP